jgi:hypothetical protein
MKEERRGKSRTPPEPLTFLCKNYAGVLRGGLRRWILYERLIEPSTQYARMVFYQRSGEFEGSLQLPSTFFMREKNLTRLFRLCYDSNTLIFQRLGRG